MAVAPPTGPAAASDPKKGKRKLVVAGVAAAAAVAILAGGAFVLTRDDAAPAIGLASDGTVLANGSGPSSAKPKSIWSVDASCDDSDDDSSAGCMISTSGDQLAAQLNHGGDAKLVSLATGSGEERWSIDLDDDQYSAWLGNTLVLLTQDCNDDSDCKSTLAVLDPGNGKQRWSVKLDGSSYPTGAVVDGAMLVAEEDGSKLLAIAIDDGKVVWSHKGGFMAACDDVVYLDTSDPDEADDGSGNGEMSAVAASDGAERWSTSVDGYLNYGAACTDVGVAVTRYTQDDDGDTTYDVTLLAEDDGKELWSKHLDSVNDVVSTGDTVLAVGDDEAVGLALADGKQRWRIDIDTADDYPVEMVSEGNFVIAIGGDRAAVIAPDTGKEIRSVDLGTGTANLTTDLILLEGAHDVRAYRISDLEKVWTVDADEPHAVATGDGKAFVLTTDGIEAFE